jgi:hypothetical protein
LTKAEKRIADLFAKFMHYEGDEVHYVEIPNPKNLALIAYCTDIGYISDKMIFPSDRKPKERGYIHEMEAPEDSPVYLMEDGQHLIIKLPVPITAHGIEG